MRKPATLIALTCLPASIVAAAPANAAYSISASATSSASTAVFYGSGRAADSRQGYSSADVYVDDGALHTDASAGSVMFDYTDPNDAKTNGSSAITFANSISADPHSVSFDFTSSENVHFPVASPYDRIGETMNAYIKESLYLFFDTQVDGSLTLDWSLSSANAKRGSNIYIYNAPGAVPPYYAGTLSDSGSGSTTIDLPAGRYSVELSLDDIGTAANSGTDGTHDGSNFTNDSITFSILDSALPEPSTWAMMLIGFGLTAMAMRRAGTKAGAGPRHRISDAARYEYPDAHDQRRIDIKR